MLGPHLVQAGSAKKENTHRSNLNKKRQRFGRLCWKISHSSIRITLYGLEREQRGGNYAQLNSNEYTVSYTVLLGKVLMVPKQQQHANTQKIGLKILSRNEKLPSNSKIQNNFWFYSIPQNNVLYFSDYNPFKPCFLPVVCLSYILLPYSQILSYNLYLCSLCNMLEGPMTQK